MLRKLFRFVAVTVFFLAIGPAIAQDDASRLAVGEHFIAALKLQRFDEAASMFASGSHDKAQAAKIAGILKRVGEHVGGFGNMKTARAPLLGPSRRLEVAGQPRPVVGEHVKFLQMSFKAKAVDGEPVYYSIAFTPNGQPVAIRSFVVEVPTADARASARAVRLFAQIEG